MESYYHSPSALFKTLTERPNGIVQLVQLSVYLYPYCLKGSFCGVTTLPPYRRRITFFHDFGKLTRRADTFLFPYLGYFLGNLFPVAFLAVFKEIFAENWGIRSQDVLSAALLTLRIFSSFATEYSLTTLKAVRYWSLFILISKGAS